MSEFRVNFHLKNWYRTISVFHVKFNVEFTPQAVNFSIVYTTQVKSACHVRWLASSEVISQVLFTSEQLKKNKMASRFK